MATRSYSPAKYSPFAPRSYKSRGRKSSSPLGSFSFLTLEKTKHFQITLWIIAAVLLILAAFFSFCLYLNMKKSRDEIQDKFPQLLRVTDFMDTKGGKALVGVLWVMFGLTVLPMGAGEWFRSQEKNLL